MIPLDVKDGGQGAKQDATNQLGIQRRKSRQVNVGGILVGGGAPVTVQTMTKTKTADVNATVDQILRCKDAGADIVRVTVNDKDAAEGIAEIVKRVDIPIVADIHFNYVFAIKAIEAGVAKVRINPGNIGTRDRIEQVLAKAKERQIPIRIGVNSGSLEKDILEKHGYPTADALFESAMKHVNIAGEFGFEDIVISVKSTSVPLMISAYRKVAENTDYPLHLGVTEAGTPTVGNVKSAVGIGTLLAEGIGDTLRVSLTDEPEREVELGTNILRVLGLTKSGVNIISCPTCGRLDVDMFKITNQIEEALKNVKKDITVAILGCAVNGPGEASEADIGLACHKNGAWLYKRGEKIRNLGVDEITSVVLDEVEKF